ncbi:MAG: hypothetical protein ACLFRG_20160 [Desulfococcaceae bacterium]
MKTRVRELESGAAPPFHRIHRIHRIHRPHRIMEARSQILAETEEREAEDAPGIAPPLIARLADGPSAYFHSCPKINAPFGPDAAFWPGPNRAIFPPEDDLDIEKSGLRTECLQKKCRWPKPEPEQVV